MLANLFDPLSQYLKSFKVKIKIMVLAHPVKYSIMKRYSLPSLRRAYTTYILMSLVVVKLTRGSHVLYESNGVVRWLMEYENDRAVSMS